MKGRTTLSERYLSDVIGDIDKLVEEHGKKIIIVSGVGSGKTTWVKETLAKQGRVLFITSRRAKADEDLADSSFERLEHGINKDNLYITTNAGLESLLREIYNVRFFNGIDDSAYEKLMDAFDYLVVDEVHSIATDSSFAHSSFTVHAFMHYAIEKGKMVIGLTGTLEPMADFYQRNKWSILDLRRECRSVYPSKISLINGERKYTVMGDFCLNSDRHAKAVYFTNRKDSIPSLIQEVVSRHIVSPSEIAVIVASSSKKSLEEDLKTAFGEENHSLFGTSVTEADQIIRQSERTYNRITEEKVIPEDCRLVISTSTLREGVDIKNPNVTVFIENHILTNIIQFCGRIRSGDNEVYIIRDAQEHRINHDPLLYHYAEGFRINNDERDCSFITNANSYLCSLTSRHEVQQQTDEGYVTEDHPGGNLASVQHFINHIEQINPYAYFDYLTGKFWLFDIKYEEEDRLRAIQSMSDGQGWIIQLQQYCSDHNICFDDVVQRSEDSALQSLNSYLSECAESKTRFIKGSTEQSALIMRLQRALSTGLSSVGSFNDLMTSKSLPYEIDNGHRARVDGHTRSYWQIIRIDMASDADGQE